MVTADKSKGMRVVKSAFLSRNQTPSRFQSGMTLLEVMVALVIFAVASLALMQSITAQLNAIADLENKTFAGWVADNELARLRLEQTWPDTEWHGGTSIMGNHTYQWRWQGQKTADKLIQQVTIEVYGQDHMQSPVVTLQSFLLKPEKQP